MDIRVMSWNIWHGEFLEEVIKTLKNSRADIIALQEVSDYPDQPRMALRIAEALGYHHAYYRAFTSDRHDPPHDQGNAVLSRFELTGTSGHFLSGLDVYAGTAETEPRIAVKTGVRLGNTELTVLNTHLAHTVDLSSCETRLRQIDELLSHVEPERMVLLGDFNVEPGSEELQKVSRVLANADPAPTVPTAFLYDHDTSDSRHVRTEPQVRIDHIFVTPDVKVKALGILDTVASDHYPLVADLRISE